MTFLEITAICSQKKTLNLSHVVVMELGNLWIWLVQSFHCSDKRDNLQLNQRVKLRKGES